MDRSLVNEIVYADLCNLIGKDVFVINPDGKEFEAKIRSVTKNLVEIEYIGSVLDPNYKTSLKRFIPLHGDYDFRPKVYEPRKENLRSSRKALRR